MAKLIISLTIIFLFCLNSSFQKEIKEQTIKGIPCIGKAFHIDTNSMLKQKLCTSNSSQLTKEQFFLIVDKNIECISTSQKHLKLKNNASLVEAEIRRECLETTFSDFEELRGNMCSEAVEVEFGKSAQIEQCVRLNYSRVAIEQNIWQNAYNEALFKNETDTDEEIKNAVCDLINCSMDIFQKAIDGKLEDGKNFSSNLSFLYPLFVVAIYVSITF